MQRTPNDEATAARTILAGVMLPRDPTKGNGLSVDQMAADLRNTEWHTLTCGAEDQEWRLSDFGRRSIKSCATPAPSAESAVHRTVAGSQLDHFDIGAPRCSAGTTPEKGLGMPEKELTVAQRSTLLALMIRASAVPATFLTNTVKISLKPDPRNELRDGGYITVIEKPRIVMELTEKGWGRAIQEFDADVPPRGGALGGTLYLLLHFLRGYLDQNDLAAAEFFASGTAPSPSDLDTQIRKVYGELAPKSGAYVMLEDMRAGLPGASRTELDATLVQLDRAQMIHLIPESNQKVLTAEQRAAAIRIGNQDMHLLAIRT